MLKFEISRPQHVVDGESFLHATTLLVAAAFLVLFASQMNRFIGGLPPLTSSVYWTFFDWPKGAALDFAVPWTAGAALLPTIPICLLIFAYLLPRASSLVLAALARADEKLRAAALGAYCSAAFAWFGLYALFPVGNYIWFIVRPFSTYFTSGSFEEDLHMPLIVRTLMQAVLICPPLIVLLMSIWIGAKIGRAGLLRGISAGLCVLLLWILDALLALGLIPWFIGYTWIAIDSLR